MQFRLYLLDVSALEDDSLRQKALSLMDSFRKGKIYKYKTLKDQLHQIATGLLLQRGLLELEPPGVTRLEYGCKTSVEESCSINDVSGTVFVCQVEDIIRSLEEYRDCNIGISFPVEAQYGLMEEGKPYWKHALLEQFPTKKFSKFSISHSGAYAALAISDKEIGLDVQQERNTAFVGGCQEFSRMESFVKCTGEGYAKGFSKYKQLEKNTKDFIFDKIDVLSGYVIYLCHSNKD